MSVVTDTTNHEKGVGVVVLGWQTTRAWIPAYAGMTVGVALVLKGGFETRPYEYRLAGSHFQRNHSCSPAAAHRGDENVCGAEVGNHKGCPYDGFVGAYFRTMTGSG